MSEVSPIILWLRRDLRLQDNPALSAAVSTGKPVICLYILETNMQRPWGAASLWWLHHSLTDLSRSLEKIGANLYLRKGVAKDILDEIITRTGADQIVWNRRYDKDARDRDAVIKSNLTQRGLAVESFCANLLSEPWTVKTKTDSYYKVFTPYWRAAREHLNVADPFPAPTQINGYDERLQSESLSNLNLLPTVPDWGAKMQPYWKVGEAGAQAALESFLDGPVNNYSEDRDRPDVEDGTSHLSPHLAFGEISPRQIWYACKKDEAAAQKFLSEIGWREFAYVLLYHNPKLASENFKEAFNSFEWDEDEQALERWQRGMTGYPFVDAGMRQLWQTGWQHNRVRMVTASFLIKHLLLDWRHGERWFWDTLLDADPANNAAGWQWVAGSGADASPYFRIFNPFTQGEKFDPNGDYVRKYVPELKHLPNKFIHRPWDAPELVLLEAGIKLGETYPRPMVDHKQARDRALQAYKDSRRELS